MDGPIEILHAAVDAAAAALSAMHGRRLRCGPGCAGCCVDDLTVFEVEATRIRREFGGLLRSASPAGIGACAMLDTDGRCRIYAARPYVCRTQGLPLRWLDLPEPDEVVEGRDICPLNDAEPWVVDAPIEWLEPEQCWTIGPVEERLAALQGDGRRVALRDLFGR